MNQKTVNKKTRLKGVFAKNGKGILAYLEKYSMVIASNLTSICCACVYMKN